MKVVLFWVVSSVALMGTLLALQSQHKAQMVLFSAGLILVNVILILGFTRR